VPDAPLSGRIAIVTGAGRRIAIGIAIARRLSRDGAGLLTHSWQAHDAEQPWGADPADAGVVLDDLPEHAPIEHVSADLADEDAPRRLVEAARAAFGHVDILVANHARSSSQSLEDLTADELDRSYAVNTRATLLLAKAFAAQHDGRPGGRIILFTSGQYHSAMAAELPYIASKAAIQGVTASLAVHLAPRGITVNCIDPGPTDTGYADAETLAAVAAKMPGGRWGAPDDAARLVAWLASDEAAWVTGQTIASDGGWSSR
jgi:3-oxoacyl-[acyl-carrier protein] reductase